MQKPLRKIFFFLMLPGVLLSFRANAEPFVQFKPLIRCEGPSGSAVIDEFKFQTHGKLFFQNQMVIRTPGINEYLMQANALAPETKTHFPSEIILPLERHEFEFSQIPETLIHQFSTMAYRVTINLPTVTLEAFPPLSCGERAADWIFRECWAEP